MADILDFNDSGRLYEGNTIKEICDVVTSEVIKQVQQNLSQMKPDLIKVVTEASVARSTEAVKKLVDAEYSVAFHKLQNKNADLENRLALLEAKIMNQTVSPNSDFAEKPDRIKAKAVDGINTLSAEKIDDILSFPNFCREANGWIYYIKVIKCKYSSDNYGFLYKVRPDGTENQKIFAGKVSGTEISAELYFKVKDDRLSFRDIDGNERVIRV